MTGQDISDRVAELRQRLSSGSAQDHTKVHDEILSLIDAIANYLSERDHSKTVRFRTSPDGETIDA